MSACPSCEAEVPSGSRWCAICHVNLVNQKIGRLAPPYKRLIAYALDQLIPVLAVFSLLVAATAASPESTSLSLPLLFILLALGAYAFGCVVLFTNGTSPGKKILRLRVIKEDGRTADFFTMLIRETFGRAISTLVFSLGLLWILIDKDNQAWHDKLMRTYVVESIK